MFQLHFYKPIFVVLVIIELMQMIFEKTGQPFTISVWFKRLNLAMRGLGHAPNFFGFARAPIEQLDFRARRKRITFAIDQQ